MSDTPKIDIVFDGPPGPESGRFVEVEDADRCGLRRGEWVERDDGYWVLRMPDYEALQRDLAAANEENARLRDIIEVLFEGLDEEWKRVEREAIASIRAALEEGR